jgi:hypothetical protein
MGIRQAGDAALISKPVFQRFSALDHGDGGICFDDGHALAFGPTFTTKHCWRWFRDRDDRPWYPSVRLYRQQIDCRWEQVLQRVADDLLVLKPAQ